MQCWKVESDKALETMEKVMDYKRDNWLFLHDFQVVLGKMINNGYSAHELKNVDL